MTKSSKTRGPVGAICLPGLISAWVAPAWADDGQVMQWATGLVTGCWACKTMDSVVDIGLGVAESVFTAVAGETATLVGLLMGIWILFLAAKTFLPFGSEGEGAALWNRGAKKLFQLALVLAFLQSSESFWNYVFIPLMSACTTLASSIIQISDPYEVSNGVPQAGPGAETTQPCVQATGSGLEGAKSVMHQLNCPLSKIQRQFSKGILVGVAVIYGGVQSDIGLSYFGRVLVAVVSGGILITVFFWGFLLFPLLLLDSVVRLSIIAAFAPLAIAASLFRPTRRICERALWGIVQAGLTLVFVSIIGGLGKAVLSDTFNNLPATVGTTLPDWQHLIDALENQTVIIDFSREGFYKLVGVAVILLYMLRRATHMAAEFSGAQGGDFSGTGAGVATLVGGAAEFAGDGAQTVVRSSGRVVGGGAKAAYAGAKSLAARVSGQDRGDDGEPSR